MHQDVFSRGLEGVGLREPGPLFLQGDPPLVATNVLPPGHSGGVDYDVSVAHQHSPPRLVSVSPNTKHAYNNAHLSFFALKAQVSTSEFSKLAFVTIPISHSLDLHVELLLVRLLTLNLISEVGVEAELGSGV